MTDLAKKIYRQTIILGLAMNPDAERFSSVQDFCDLFGVEALTINRDLKDLRFAGISIGSRNRLGIKYDAGLDEQKVHLYISTFSALKLRNPAADKATALAVKKHGVNALYIFVTLQHCIENKICVEIEYEKSGGEISKRVIEPIDLFVNEGQWRVVAQEKGKKKQYLLVKIHSISATGKTFMSESNAQSELLKNAWGSWMGEDEFLVKLHFDKERAAYIRPKQLIENQRIEEQPDGTLIFSATVNSLREIGTWVLGWGRGCKVLEPVELRDLVIRLARETLKQYE